MSYINKGDLIEIRWWVGTKATWMRAIATSEDYIRRVPGNGEFLDDYTYVPSVAYLVPENGSAGIARLGDIRRV